MPLSRPVEILQRAPLAARVLAALALIVGLLGMHVLTSPASHAAHGATNAAAAVMTSISPVTHPHSGSASAPSTHAVPATDRAHDHLSCASACPALDRSGSSPGQDDSIWSVICVLALLLTAVLLVPPRRSWLLSWRLSRPDVRQRAADGDRAPRHPPSLHLLSISRT